MRYVPFLLISVIFSQDVTRVSEFKTSTFQGKECDDTEYRNEWGRPNWKNYGSWLSECDSLATTFIDAEFAIKRKIKQEEERLAREKILAEPLEELDLDVMWENTVWEEIQDIQEDVTYETEYITAVAGVRGAEAEDEALALLYYRKSMKKLSKLDLQRALGKLIIKKEKMLEKKLDISKIDSYIIQLRKKIKNT
tara:strand:+ start:728 stop:1312 length:585 start_codon:yes stop_codon:yes gene_type:complete